MSLERLTSLRGTPYSQSNPIEMLCATFKLSWQPTSCNTLLPSMSRSDEDLGEECFSNKFGANSNSTSCNNQELRVFLISSCVQRTIQHSILIPSIPIFKRSIGVSSPHSSRCIARQQRGGLAASAFMHTTCIMPHKPSWVTC